MWVHVLNPYRTVAATFTREHENTKLSHGPQAAPPVVTADMGVGKSRVTRNRTENLMTKNEVDGPGRPNLNLCTWTGPPPEILHLGARWTYD
jgi:hypothetical protein